ncbi:MAG TPA: glycosyltransferase family 4 protein [Acidimicrobiales bacterium]|nr:glycosyltransferase family 4 protein [Acidimicrobiales bacterium]
MARTVLGALTRRVLQRSCSVRILQVTEASYAGTLRIVETLCCGLARQGDEVTLAFGRHPETPPVLGGDSEYDVHELDWDRRTAAAQVTAARQLRGLVARLRPDVVHLHSTFAGLVGGALDRSVPRLYTPHGWASTHRDWPYRVVGAVADRIAARRSDVVGTVSEAEAEVARRFGARRVVVVANGLPELDDHAPPVRRVDDGAAVVAGGRLVGSRRPVESARILRSLDGLARTRWVGGGPATMVEAVEALGVPVTGWLPHHEVLEHLARTTAYLHWSATDGQSVAVLEAIARDVVVIASDIPANREILDGDQLFASSDEAARMLRRVVEEPGLRMRLLEAQRARGRGHGAERMVKGWSDAYRRTLGAD